MEFLPYHWLLATVGNAGYLKYQDTSTGSLVAEMPTKQGSPTSLVSQALTLSLCLTKNRLLIRKTP